MKVALDGPKTEDFVPFAEHKCQATPRCNSAQNWYFKMHGGRRYQKDRGEASWGSGRQGVQKER